MVAERVPAQKSKAQPKAKRPTEASAPAVFPDILTPEQAAAYLQVSVGAVLAQARGGVLPGQKVGREWRFSRQRLLQWVQADYVSDEQFDAALAALVDQRAAEAGPDDFVPWEEVKRDLGL